MFQRIGLLSKPGCEADDLKVLHDIAELLQQQTCDVFAEEALVAQGFPAQVFTPNTALDLWVVVGGDGSMLNAGRLAVTMNVPVLGVNRGKLGFLTDIKPQALHSKLTAILAGDFHQEQRFLLEGQVVQANGEIVSHMALNDIVLYLGSATHLIEFTIEIDGLLMCRQRADGMIVSTPTGSTAYSLSAGGPILHPGLSAIALVPMFPHKLTSRPIVIDSAAVITIQLENAPVQGPLVSFDSQYSTPFALGDVLTIRQKPERLQLIHPKDYDYFATLRNKLHWESR